MSVSIVPNTFKHVVTYGNPYHGLNVNSVLTLSNGQSVAGVMDSSKRRIGDCYEVRVPGHTYTDPQAFGNHLKFEPYALISGFEDRRLYNYKLHLGDKNTFIYCDANKVRWLVTIDPTPTGTKTAFVINVTLKKFGEFFGTPQTYTYALSAGDPAITTATMAGYKLEVVNFNKDGSLAVIGLCLEDSTTESQSTCQFDRQYGYPLAFFKLQITSATNLTASVYRNKTYCERTVTNYSYLYKRAFWMPYSSVKTEKIKNPANGAVIRTTVTRGEFLGFMVWNSDGDPAYVYQPTLPAGTSTSSLEVTYAWDGITINATNWRTTIGVNSSSGSVFNTQIRTIHVFIKDDNTLVDVECSYNTDQLGWGIYCSTDKENFSSWNNLKNFAMSMLSFVTDNRVVITGDIQSKTGTANINIDNYYNNTTGSTYIYSLLIGGSTKSSVSFNSRSNSQQAVTTVTVNADGTYTSYTSPVVVVSDNTYNGPSAGTIYAVPLTSYKNYKGWMSKGTYTLSNGTQVTPFIQIYTNNLVGMIEGNANTSNPDNAHWDTGSGGTMIAMPIYNKNSAVVSSQQSINALDRYCSWHPVNNTFSGISSVPVCYV